MKQTRRKGFEWFRLLTKKQQKQFRNNLINRTKNQGIAWNEYLQFVLNTNVRSFDFIFGSFVPSQTKEGLQYWETIIQKLNNK